MDNGQHREAAKWPCKDNAPAAPSRALLRKGSPPRQPNPMRSIRHGTAPRSVKKLREMRRQRDHRWSDDVMPAVGLLKEPREFQKFEFFSIRDPMTMRAAHVLAKRRTTKTRADSRARHREICIMKGLESVNGVWISRSRTITMTDGMQRWSLQLITDDSEANYMDYTITEDFEMILLNKSEFFVYCLSEIRSESPSEAVRWTFLSIFLFCRVEM